MKWTQRPHGPPMRFTRRMEGFCWRMARLQRQFVTMKPRQRFEKEDVDLLIQRAGNRSTE